MAVSVVGGWESGQELAGSPFVLKNAWICFIISFSFVGNNPSLHIRSLSEIWGKCNRTCDPTTDRPFSSVPMRQDPNVADSSYVPWYEAYEHSLSLSSLLLLMPCWEGKASPMSDIFSPKFSLKDYSARKNCVYFVAYCLYTDYRSWFATYPHLVSIFTSP